MKAENQYQKILRDITTKMNGQLVIAVYLVTLAICNTLCISLNYYIADRCTSTSAAIGDIVNQSSWYHYHPIDLRSIHLMLTVCKA